MAATTHRFPGESRAYRAARNKLLDAELKLRKVTARSDLFADYEPSATRTDGTLRAAAC